MDSVLDEALWLVVVFAALLAVATWGLAYPSKARIARVGIDPGPFSLKLWPSRISWIRSGHDLVKKRYHQVGLSSLKFRIGWVQCSPSLQIRFAVQRPELCCSYVASGSNGTCTEVS